MNPLSSHLCRICPAQQLRIWSVTLTVTAVLVVPIFASRTYADDRTLDLTFGSDGRVTTDFFGTPEGARDVVVQPDGKIIAAGFAINPGRRADFALARYLPDGTLDFSFGSGGKVTTDFFGGADGLAAIVVQRDGKIVAAGGANSTLALARYTASGALDATFGIGGKVTVNGVGGASALALQDDGKLVAGVPFMGLVRVNADGTLDSTFGTGGRVAIESIQFILNDVAVHSDGRIVAPGSDVIIIGPDPEDPEGSLGRSVFGIRRFNSNGSVDSAFGNGGTVLTDAGSLFSDARAVVIQSDDRIVAVGNIDNDFGLVRYNFDGSLDTTFGNAGSVITDFAGEGDIALAAAIHSDDKVVAAGWAIVGGMGNNFAVARYNTDGSLDTTFGEAGLATTDFLNNTADIANGVAIAPDGAIVAAGSTNLGDFPTATFALARYLGTLSPQDALRNLLLGVTGLVESGVLNAGQGRALAATLNGAARQLEAENAQAAANELNAFMRKVNALVSAGILSPSQGQLLIDQSNEILSRI